MIRFHLFHKWHVDPHKRPWVLFDTSAPSGQMAQRFKTYRAAFDHVFLLHEHDEAGRLVEEFLDMIEYKEHFNDAEMCMTMASVVQPDLYKNQAADFEKFKRERNKK